MHYHACHVLSGDMQTDTHKHTTYACRQHLYEYTLCSHNSVCIKKWPQGDWINYSELQVGVFGLPDMSESHKGNSDTAS